MSGRGRSSPEHPKHRDSGPSSFYPQWEYRCPRSRPVAARSRPGETAEDASGRGRPRPRGPPERGPAPSRGRRQRGPRRAAEAGKGGVPLPRQGRWEERPLPVSGRGLGLRAPPGRAGARLAGREPAGAKGEGRGKWTRPQVPCQAGRAGRGGYRRRRPVSQSRRCPLGAAAETAGTSPREEPQPERRAAEAEEGRGHRVGDPLTRKYLWSRRRALRDGLDLPRPAARRRRRDSGPRVG